MSLRWRLTAWYTAALGGLLVLLGTTALVLLDRGLRANIDASLASVARTIAASSREPGGLGADVDEALESLLGPGAAERFLQLLDPLGRSDPRWARRSRVHLPLSEIALRNAREGRETFETLTLPAYVASPVRLLTFPVTERGGLTHVLQVAMPLASVDAARSRFLLILLGLGPLAVGAVAAGSWLLAGRALSPVDAMVNAARHIGARNLGLRIEGAARDDEIGRLASVLNDMLDRLDRAFSAARQFSADAAHELRTPLTVLKGEIDVALHSAQSPDGYRRALASCREEADRLVALVEDLLFLAGADAEAVQPRLEPLDFATVIEDVAPALHVLADRAGVTLNTSYGRGVWVRGSAPMLFRMTLNLAENAIKYAGGGGRVEIALADRERTAVLEVRDDGPGIAPQDQVHIFDRFYRGDPARTRGGTGLGLALVRSIVLIHGGAIGVESELGKGSCFRVVLPLAGDDAPRR